MNKNKEILRALKFVLFSASAGIIQLASFSLLNEATSIGATASYAISLALSVIWNFTFNRKFTFKSANNVPKAMLLVTLFYCVFAPLSISLEDYLVGKKVNEYLVTAINMGINLVTEYIYDTFVVFRGSIDSAVKDEA